MSTAIPYDRVGDRISRVQENGFAIIPDVIDGIVN